MKTTARILVVDDEVSIVSLVSRALAARGFRVDSAADGERALQLVRTDAHQLVILDLILPGLGGVATLKRIKGVRPSCPCSFCPRCQTSSRRSVASSSVRRTI